MFRYSLFKSNKKSANETQQAVNFCVEYDFLIVCGEILNKQRQCG
jgi:hypothetical protein